MKRGKHIYRHAGVCDCSSDTDTTKSHQSTEAEEYRHSQATPGGQRQRKRERESTCLADMRKRGDEVKCLYKGAGKYGYEHCVCNRDM